MQSYIGFIFMSALTFSPRGFLYCHGTTLAISQFTTLFSLLGVKFGGDGRTTFMLPDMRGRVPVGAGQAPGLSPYPLGQRGGTEGVVLNTQEIPAHNHTAVTVSAPNITSPITGTVGISPACNNGNGTTNNPVSNYPAVIPKVGKSAVTAYATAGNDAMGSFQSPMAGSVSLDLPAQTVTVGLTGSSLQHENRQPFTVIDYVICNEGIYPPRN